jgi:hypothetical protein
MSSSAWNLLALILGGIGASVALVGTLMIANGYYPTTIGHFLLALPGLLWHAIRGQRTRFEIAQKFAQEDRAVTLMGVLVMFIGFLFQIVAAICAFIGTLPETPTSK